MDVFILSILYIPVKLPLDTAVQTDFFFLAW